MAEWSIQDNPAKEQQSQIPYQLCSPSSFCSHCWFFSGSTELSSISDGTFPLHSLKTHLLHFLWVRPPEKDISKNVRLSTRTERKLCCSRREVDSIVQPVAKLGRHEGELPPTSLHRTRAHEHPGPITPVACHGEDKQGCWRTELFSPATLTLCMNNVASSVKVQERTMAANDWWAYCWI